MPFYQVHSKKLAHSSGFIALFFGVGLFCLIKFSIPFGLLSRELHWQSSIVPSANDLEATLKNIGKQFAWCDQELWCKWITENKMEIFPFDDVIMSWCDHMHMYLGSGLISAFCGMARVSSGENNAKSLDSREYSNMITVISVMGEMATIPITIRDTKIKMNKLDDKKSWKHLYHQQLCYQTSTVSSLKFLNR